MEYIHQFLGISEPVQANVLAVEEWISPCAMEGAAYEFQAHGCTLLVVLGDERRWVPLALEKAGVDEKKIVAVHFDPGRKDRTFAAAVALRNWFLSSGMSGEPVNLFALGVHARRSLLLFHEALGPDWEFGIISCENPNYDPQKWWESSEGFKTVLDETLAYIYTRLYFLPANKIVRREQ